MMLNELTIKEAHKKLKSREISSTELTQAVLDEIEKKDPKFSCYLTKTPETALKKAEKVDKKIAEGEKLGPLAGIPVAIKDNILVKDVRCTAGSKILENYIAPYSATVTKRLKEQCAIIVGKTNLDEFAMGSSTENSGFEPTKNPVDTERVPGGSSGGSAAAVAADECIYALGSDTGGSIRQPASFCGVVGLKPTYGAVSRYGLIAMASSLDQIGPIAKNAEDAEIVFDALSGKDPMDSTSVDYRFRIENCKLKIENLRIGVPKEYFIEGIDPEVEKSVKKAITDLEGLGVKIEEISLPHTKYALVCYYIIMSSEVSANLARYDGIKYGKSVASDKSVTDLFDVYFRSRKEGFGDEVTRRIMLGTYALSAGYYEAYYLKAQKVRTLVKKDFEEAFKKVDVIVTPTSPTVAFRFGERTADPLSMYLSDIYTVSANIAGVPGISIPCGVANGLPIGLQFMGKHFDEKTVLGVARVYEEMSSGK